MLIRAAMSWDIDLWVQLRAHLWADPPLDEHRSGAMAILAKPVEAAIAFVAVDQTGALCGFAEAALRHDYVNGCKTSPVAFLEGLYVRPENRNAGIGRNLLTAVKSWARDRGCSEIASDTGLENVAGQAFPAAAGFEETERVVYFRQRL